MLNIWRTEIALQVNAIYQEKVAMTLNKFDDITDQLMKTTTNTIISSSKKTAEGLARGTLDGKTLGQNLQDMKKALTEIQAIIQNGARKNQIDTLALESGMRELLKNPTAANIALPPSSIGNE
jgi:uncharacterized protein YaaN involved in tellurite resistance